MLLPCGGIFVPECFLRIHMAASQPKVTVFVVPRKRLRPLGPSASEGTGAGFFPSVLAPTGAWPFLRKVLGVSLVPQFLYKHFLCRAHT